MTTVLTAIGNQSFTSTESGGGSSAVQRPIDVLLLQEVDDSNGGEAAAVRDLLNAIYGAGTYSLGTLQQTQASGGDMQAIVYRNSTVNLLGELQVSGASGPRAPMRYQLEADAAPGLSFYIYNSHYDSADAPDRLDEADAIRTNADALGNGVHILYVGDFNIDSSSEDMYDVELLGAGNGQAFDPINRPGSWNNSSSFKDIHTQSPRTTDLGDGGASGGMDDRFDFVLHTQGGRRSRDRRQRVGPRVSGRLVSRVRERQHAHAERGHHHWVGDLLRGRAKRLAQRLRSSSRGRGL